MYLKKEDMYLKFCPGHFIGFVPKWIGRWLNSPVFLGVIKIFTAQLLNQINEMPEAEMYQTTPRKGRATEVTETYKKLQTVKKRNTK